MSPKAGVECTVSSECWLAGAIRWAAGGDGMGLPWRAKKSENHVCERCGLGGALWWGCNTMSCAVDDTPPTWGFPPHTCGVHQWYIPCSKDMYTYSTYIQCRQLHLAANAACQIKTPHLRVGFRACVWFSATWLVGWGAPEETHLGVPYVFRAWGTLLILACGKL